MRTGLQERFSGKVAEVWSMELSDGLLVGATRHCDGAKFQVVCGYWNEVFTVLELLASTEWWQALDSLDSMGLSDRSISLGEEKIYA